MPVEPCRNCNGSGHKWRSINTPMDAHNYPCEVCVDMPWLNVETVTPDGVGFHDDMWLRGRFKPDPLSVMRWCQEHNSTEDTHYQIYELTEGRGYRSGACRWSWQPTPGPGLEEADD